MVREKDNIYKWRKIVTKLFEEPQGKLLYPPVVYDGEGNAKPYEIYYEYMKTKEVGDIVRSHAGAPGVGYVDRRITRMDDTGIYGVEVENTMYVPEPEFYEDEKPYATMDDGPEDYLYRKDGKQKLVGALGLETDECSKCDGWGEIEITQGYFDADHKPTKKVCPKCEGTGKQEELAEEDNGYRYREERDEEEDNVKIWHYGKAPGEDWMIIDRSPYATMTNRAWKLYKDFHKTQGRWPNADESRRIENLKFER